MPKHRLRFSKTGRAKFISHLDLMRTFQRMFCRAGIGIWHTEGFNPHPYISVALPLSLGCESLCELMDFELVDGSPLETLPQRLTAAAPEGIRVLSAYEATRKCKEIAWLRVTGTLYYAGGVPTGAAECLETLANLESILVPKKTKKGVVDTDIAPMLRSMSVEAAGEGLCLDMVLAAQNPGLNPELVVTAIEKLWPEAKPDFARFCRMEVYDANGQVFQ